MMEALTAELGVFTLGTLLQAMEADQVTGAIRCWPEGSIVMCDGNVVAAVYGKLNGIDAALTLLMVESQRLSFEPFDVEQSAPLIGMMGLVIDGARLNDDWAVLAPQVLRPRDGADLSVLPADVKRVVRALDGRRIVHEAVDLMGVPIVTVIDDLLDLRESGTLVEASPPRPERMRMRTATPAPVRRQQHPATPVAKPDEPTDFYDLVDASRSALREKSYARALSLLERAAVLRPDERTVLQNIRRIRQMVEANS